MNVIKPFCHACPVQKDCLAYALSYPDLRGIWAGTTENGRRRIRAGRYNDNEATPLVYSNGKYRQIKDPT